MKISWVSVVSTCHPPLAIEKTANEKRIIAWVMISRTIAGTRYSFDATNTPRSKSWTIAVIWERESARDIVWLPNGPITKPKAKINAERSTA